MQIQVCYRDLLMQEKETKVLSVDLLCVGGGFFMIVFCFFACFASFETTVTEREPYNLCQR